MIHVFRTQEFIAYIFNLGVLFLIMLIIRDDAGIYDGNQTPESLFISPHYLLSFIVYILFLYVEGSEDMSHLKQTFTLCP